jgi:molybdenum cofactor biosynthesis enzyme MoaA
LALRPELTDLALTTNGILLATQAAQLRAAGLQRVTVSLDTLRPERMLSFARSSKHGDVLAGLTAARDAGFPPVKLNSVIVRGYNDDELEDLSISGSRSAWKCDLSNTWMWVGPPDGAWRRSFPAVRFWIASPGATGRLNR